MSESERFIAALDDARAQICIALNLAPGVFTQVHNWETFNNMGHRTLINIDRAKAVVNKQEKGDGSRE